MSLELIGTIGLVLIFGLSMWRGINMGIIAFVGAFLVGTVFLDMDSSTISANFPGSLLVTLVGVTLFFGVARTNGTVENIVSWQSKSREEKAGLFHGYFSYSRPSLLVPEHYRRQLTQS